MGEAESRKGSPVERKLVMEHCWKRAIVCLAVQGSGSQILWILFGNENWGCQLTDQLMHGLVAHEEICRKTS